MCYLHIISTLFSFISTSLCVGRRTHFFPFWTHLIYTLPQAEPRPRPNTGSLERLEYNYVHQNLGVLSMYHSLVDFEFNIATRV